MTLYNHKVNNRPTVANIHRQVQCTQHAQKETTTSSSHGEKAIAYVTISKLTRHT